MMSFPNYRIAFITPNHALIAWLASLLCCGLAGSETVQAERIDFNRDIRPILSENCFYCHGQDVFGTGLVKTTEDLGVQSEMPVHLDLLNWLAVEFAEHGCFASRARRVVCLWQGGGPSHVDLFDPKPMLQIMSGQDIPDSMRGTTKLSTMSSGYKHT
jgi:hypothetical protein